MGRNIIRSIYLETYKKRCISGNNTISMIMFYFVIFLLTAPIRYCILTTTKLDSHLNLSFYGSLYHRWFDIWCANQLLYEKKFCFLLLWDIFQSIVLFIIYFNVHDYIKVQWEFLKESSHQTKFIINRVNAWIIVK